MLVTFDNWINGREIAALGTNAGAQSIPFQGWRHFKEAFAPELIAKAIRESAIPVGRCIDPFSGSGTTALACQFLGVHPTFVEVNPYLADLAEAKLSAYDVASITRDFSKLVRNANTVGKVTQAVFKNAPPTLIEPGQNGRWIFDKKVADRLASFRVALRSIKDPVNRRLFRVLLGGVVIEVSNVVISGKGRRYRRNWESQRKTVRDLDDAFCRAVETAVGDIVRHGTRRLMKYTALRGDCRSILKERMQKFDLAVFSPPYPNSFDYTDVYNVELWALGYLKSYRGNAELRASTLSSHVQIKRDFAPAPQGAPTLAATLRDLDAVRADLWDRSIPEMVGGYFADMAVVLNSLWRRLSADAQIWMVVGDSRYAGISIPVGKILAELTEEAGATVLNHEPFRSMRSSPQQGGQHSLAETLLVFGR
ncbi:DNA methyltransferase [Bradyrhizobium sp. HKCCYLRH3061]|uniref:DNA methyltransferase n=1 Tax=Bradyrhizobium sp. HKCCYLRH3061 TaxID=3420734 RepID=UPI003EBB0F1E